MDYGQKFCDLAYDALSREEGELLELARQNPRGRALSMSVAGELPIAYLIMKQCLRDQSLPWLAEQYPYQDAKEKADFCFLEDPGRRPIASFEMQQFAPGDRGGWGHVRDDIKKHFDPMAKVAGDCEARQRYNVVVLFTNAAKSKEHIQTDVKNEIKDLVRNPVLYPSEPIKLGTVDSANRRALSWKYLQIVVFTGEYIPSETQEV